MKKKLLKYVALVLACATLVCTMVFAKDISETVQIWYRNIKIVIDGAEYTAKDANGNVVEPFIYNGTTYLPVRGIATAFGKDVIWDGKTQTVYLGKKDQNQPDNYLHKLQYNDYKEGDGDNDLAIINGTVTDYMGNIYKNGLAFYVDSIYGYVKDDADEANVLLAYPLNSQYKTMTGKIVLPKVIDFASWQKKDNCKTSATDVWFYGDGALLYKATGVTASMPFNISLNLLGVNQLTIKVKTQDYSAYVALTDLALYK